MIFAFSQRLSSACMSCCKLSVSIPSVISILLTRMTDTTTVFQVLKAFRSDDVSAFNTGLAEMDHAYEALGNSESLSTRLCRTLAALIVREQKEKIEILEPILENCPMDMGIDFEIGYHHVEKNKSNPDLLRVIDASCFKSRVPYGMSGQKALDWLMKDMMFA